MMLVSLWSLLRMIGMFDSELEAPLSAAAEFPAAISGTGTVARLTTHSIPLQHMGCRDDRGDRGTL